MNSIIPENKQISPFLVFFLIHAMQIGVGVLGFQRIIARHAGYDGWISIIITNLVILIILWMMYKMLGIVDGDIITIHSYFLGETISKLICSIFIFYFCLLAVTVLRNFIEIVQVWIFPELNTFWFALVFLLTVIYIINGGLRVVTGVAFFSIVLTFYILFLFILALKYAEFDNLLPIMNHSVTDILAGSRDLSLTILGFETLLFFYPFIKEPEKSKKWAYYSILFLTIVLLYLAVIAFAYFSEKQLQKNIWPTLTLWKIIRMPFVERFEYIGIGNWCLVILPNVSIALWCASRLAKQIFSIRQKKAVWGISALCSIGTSLLTTRDQINFLTDMTGKIGLYFNFIYVPLLFFVTLIAKKVKNRGKVT